MKYLIPALVVLVGINTFAASDKIDWKPCDKELKEFCTTIKDDHEKHECLEEAPKAKVSKACSTFNSSLEDKFKEKHKH